MELKLAFDMQLKDVKRQFSSAFPFLKLEFFIYPHNIKEGVNPDRKYNDRIPLSKVIGAREGLFSFSPGMTIAEFEQGLQTSFALPVQVFRKSGSVWIETTETDGLTLQKQNEMGKASVSVTKFNINTLFL